MKKFTTMAYVAALALVSTAGLTSCKNEAENDVNFKGEEVKSEFSISLPNQAVGNNGAGPNRMPGTTVQISGASQFQGMTDIVLVPFAKESDIIGSDTRLGTNIALADIEAASELGTNSHAKVYSNVSIPLTTASFLFYAKSDATGSDFEKGALNAVQLTNDNPNDFGFELQNIVAAIGTPTAEGTSGEALINYLNSIANATDGAIAWKDYTNTQSVAMTAMFETFKSWHSLSSFAVARGLSDLYNSLEPLNTTLANNIKTAIANNTYATVTGSAPNKVVTLNSTPLDLTNFPAEFKLPEGSVRIKWATDHFAACDKADYTSADNTPLDMYTYPSALWYYANSQIKTSNASQAKNYNSSNTWTQILNLHTDATAVNSRTRAVAIEDVIQYGVARLDVIVKLNATSLEDNTENTPKTITCSSYPVTAVLVGGQKNLGFDFTPASYTGAKTSEYTIYDNQMTGGSINATTENTSANSTLVLQSETGDSKDIMIAIELQNNSGKDFIGVNRELIPAGAKFYLIAKLESTPANVTAKTVFKQDYTTTATLTIKSLKNAYSTIPDLRTPQLELGMSVDLEWTAGNTYTIDIN